MTTSMKMDNAPESRPPGRAPLTSYEKIDICRGLFAFLVVAAHANVSFGPTELGPFVGRITAGAVRA